MFNVQQQFGDLLLPFQQKVSKEFRHHLEDYEPITIIRATSLRDQEHHFDLLEPYAYLNFITLTETRQTEMLDLPRSDPPDDLDITSPFLVDAPTGAWKTYLRQRSWPMMTFMVCFHIFFC